MGKPRKNRSAPDHVLRFEAVEELLCGKSLYANAVDSRVMLLGYVEFIQLHGVFDASANVYQARLFTVPHPQRHEQLQISRTLWLPKSTSRPILGLHQFRPEYTSDLCCYRLVQLQHRSNRS